MMPDVSFIIYVDFNKLILKIIKGHFKSNLNFFFLYLHRKKYEKNLNLKCCH